MEPIIVKYQSDTSGLKEAQGEMLAQLDVLQAREQELKKKIADTSKEYVKQKLDVQAAGSSIEIMDKAMAAAHQKHAKEQANLRKELKATRSGIEELNASLDDVDKTIAKGALSTTFTKRLRAIKEELRVMEDAGDTTSQRFIALSVEAAKMENQIGDTNAQIRALSSDTKGLDTVMGVGQGLTGSFAALQSGMALVGGESEALQQAFFKVQAAMQLLNGVNMVANAVNKDSNANVVIKNWLSTLTTKSKVTEAAATAASTAATTAETAAVGKATLVQRIWNATMLANPVFWIIAGIMALVGAITWLVASQETQIEKQQRINELELLHANIVKREYEDDKSRARTRIDQLNREIELLKAQGASEDDLAKKRKEVLFQRELDMKMKERDHAQDIAGYEQNVQAIKDYQSQVDRLNRLKANGSKYGFVELESGEVLKGEVDELLDTLQKQVDAKKVKVEVVEDIKADRQGLDTDAATEAAKERERVKNEAFNNAVAAAQIRILEAQKGSKEELKAREEAINTEKSKALDAAKHNAVERRRIILQADKDIEAAREAFYKKQLEDEKTEVEAVLVMAEKGSKAEFDLKKELLDVQKDVELDNKELTDNQRLLIENKYLKEVENLTKEFNKRQSEDAINTQLADANARLSAATKGSAEEYDLKKEILEKQAELERKSIEDSVTNAELKAARLKELDAKTTAEKEQLYRDRREKEISAELAFAQQEVNAEIQKNQAVVDSTLSTFTQRAEARANLKDLELEAIANERTALEEKYSAGLISEQEYELAMGALKQEQRAAEIEAELEHDEAMKAIRQAFFDFAKELANAIYEAKKASIQQEMDDLENQYTTDAEAAKENANLKLISEEEFQRRQLELKRKMAKVEKEQALFTAGIDAIAGVVKALGSAPPPYNIVLAAITAAASAVQIAQIAAKPLPKYAKGRKAGYSGGEMAWVGERGPEIMWVPDGAGIVPAGKSRSLTPDVMREFNIPIPPLPQMPYIPERVLNEFRASTSPSAMQAAAALEVDYEKLGSVIAEKIPPQNNVSMNVNMDEGGFKKYITSGTGSNRIMNRDFESKIKIKS